MVGFCFGGGIANTLAVRMGADLSAAVPFYGGQPPAADVAKIKAPLLLQYASLDARITGAWPALTAMLLNQNKHFHLAEVFAIQILILLVGMLQDYGIAFAKRLLCPYSVLTLERQ